MSIRKVRQILDLVLDYWTRTIGAALGLIALLLYLFNQIDEPTFYKFIGAMVAIGVIPKTSKKNETDER
jgi:hypothetical protein